MINKTKKNISDYAEGVYIKSITIQVTIWKEMWAI
jgi:hypothetical protein